MTALTDDQGKLLEQVPSDGSTISNPRLREKLGWTDPSADGRYFGARDALVDRDLLRLGRGRGGTVARTETLAADGTAEAPAPPPTEEELAERKLYGAIEAQLRDGWAKVTKVTPLVVSVTAHLGGRRTGKWSRPDLVTVEVHRYEVQDAIEVEIATYEVKRADALDVTAVYEAVSHSRAATRSYVLVHVPPAKVKKTELRLQSVVAVAREHGIGVIVARSVRDYREWDEVVPAVPTRPHPSRVEEFMRTQFSTDDLEKIARRVRDLRGS